MKFLEYRFNQPSSASVQDMLIAFLDSEGFTGILETAGALLAYLPEKDRKDDEFNALLKNLLPDEAMKFDCHPVPDVNWNARWESEFQPIEIDGAVRVRASFHAIDTAFQYDIIIDPRMSFGTGHHQTTRLMIRAILDEVMTGKVVLDLGSGTGVLAILAMKRSAKQVVAADVDEWSYRNCLENIQANDCGGIEVFLGGMENVSQRSYDVILANINRNVLLDLMPLFSKQLNPGGSLLLSGIMENDQKVLQEKALECGFRRVGSYQEGEWVANSFKSILQSD